MNRHQALRWATTRLLLASLLVTVLVAVLYTAELCFWLADPQRKLPPASYEQDGLRYTWGHPVHRNQLGFRSRDVAPKPEGVLRIMVLGDSLTWGAGVAAEVRYTDILERRLFRDLDGGNVEVHNFAVSGGPMVLHARVLESYIGLVQPDLIVVGFCYNDGLLDTRHPSDWSPQKQRFDEKYGLGLEKMKNVFARLGLSHIGRRMERVIRRVAELRGVYPDRMAVIDWTYDPNSTQWHMFVRALRRIKYLSDNRRLPPPIFASLNHGVYLRKRIDYARPDALVATFLRWYQQAEAVAESFGDTVVDFHKRIAEQLDGRSLGVNALDNHPSPALHQLYADTLYPVVRRIMEQRRLSRETKEDGTMTK